MRRWLTSFLVAIAFTPLLAQRPANAPPTAPSGKPPDSVFLEDLTWAEVRDLVKSGWTTAIAWAGEALKHATAMEAAAAAGKWDEVKAAASSIQPLCAQCHGEHRERMDDGTYRIKSGG